MPASVDAQALAASLHRLRQQRDGLVLEESLRVIVDACVDLFGLDGSGIMLVDEHGALRHVAATDPQIRLLERLQLETGEGPCIESFLHDVLVGCEDVRTDERWPALAERLTAVEIGGVLGVPVHLQGVPVGSLDVYCRSAHSWSEFDRDALVRFCDVAEAVIATAVRAERVGELAERLTSALDRRMPVERATGYLMARDRLGRPAALERLRRAAQAQGCGLGDVATDLLVSGRLPDDY